MKQKIGSVQVKAVCSPEIGSDTIKVAVDLVIDKRETANKLLMSSRIAMILR